MNLRDPTRKMSKSARSDYSRINLLDTPDDIRLKIIKAKTDSENSIKNDPDRIGLSNLYRIFSAVTEYSVEQIEEMGWNDILHFKEGLSEALIEHLKPIREKTREILQQDSIKNYLSVGTKKAQGLAYQHMKEISKIVGYLP